MPAVDSKQLLFSKWTAIQPCDREKHFVVRRVFKKRGEESKAICVELEAVISKRMRLLSLQELRDATRWARGWNREDPASD